MYWHTQKGLKGFNLHWMFLTVFAQKYSKLCSCVHYRLNFVQENVKNCTGTRTLISHFASEFSLFCFVPRPLARSRFRKIPDPSPVNSLHYKTWVRLCYGSVSKCLMCAVVSPWTPLGNYNSALTELIAGFTGPILPTKYIPVSC